MPIDKNDLTRKAGPPAALINTKTEATVVAAFYILFTIWAVRDLIIARQGQPLRPESMPIIKTIGFAACIFGFLTLQRKTKNALEKVAALASAGSYIPVLLYLASAEVHFNIPPILKSQYWNAVLVVIATIAVMARAIEVFIDNRVSHELP
jgi:hypothetical protein